MDVSVLRRGLDTYGGTDFVRERLALFGKVVFLLSFGFWVGLNSTFVLVGGAPLVETLSMRTGLAHLAGSSTMGLLWLLASRRACSLSFLGTLDAAAVFLGPGFLAGMAIDP